MIIVKLAGGLGNQMFQYAFGKTLALKYNTTLKIDTFFLLDRRPRSNFTFRDYDLDIFNIDDQFATQSEISKFTKRLNWSIADRILNKLIGVKKNFIIEPHFYFSEQCKNAGDNSYLEGYWQSEKYFDFIKDDLKNKYFAFKEPFSINASTMLTQIQNTNAVAVNVRRGDFVNNPFHGTCSPEYYKKATEIISEKVSHPHFFVFSDEIDWAKENLIFSHPVTFVSEEYNGRKYQDKMRLMSACKHFIIPNSSFAWWSVFLNSSANKIVIAPSKWFPASKNTNQDAILSNWITI